jgi:hypothetical protein
MPILRRTAVIAGGLSVALAAAAALLAPERGASAADHLDPPARTDPAFDPAPDKAADIADIYAFHTADTLSLILTFAGPQSTSLPGVYDRDVRYVLNISNAGAATDAEIPIDIRFGNDGSRMGIRVTGVPGAAGPIEGPVETVLTSNAVRVYAGLRDDPFFFDSQGLRESRAMGTLRFNANRNFFAAQNITVVAIDIPRAAVQNGSNPLHIWSTASRFGGQI